MKKNISIITLIFISLTLSGCASYFKKQSCNKINWFEHGQKVAMSGRWLNADETLKECRKVEADVAEAEVDRGFKSGVAMYCSKEHVEKLGRQGQKFSKDLCQGPQLATLEKSYKSGVIFFCTPENAYNHGSSGGLYDSNCPSELEANFLKSYNRGRVIWIDASVKQKESEIRDLEFSLPNLRNQASLAEMEVSSYRTLLSNLEIQKNLALSNNNQTAIHHYDSEINRLNRELNTKQNQKTKLNNDIAQNLSRTSSLKNEIFKLKSESEILKAK